MLLYIKYFLIFGNCLKYIKILFMIIFQRVLQNVFNSDSELFNNLKGIRFYFFKGSQLSPNKVIAA